MKKTRFLIHLSLFLLLSSVMGIYQWFESPVHSQDAPPPIEVSGASFVHDMGIVAPQIAALTTEQQTLGNCFIIEGARMKNN